jgi:DNA-binding transcriptional ArsR family regulator
MAIRILIKKINTPPAGSLKEDIDFVCKSFGYFSPRDKQDTAGKIFRLLVRESCKSGGLTSDQIAEQLDLTRGAIVHHLNSFIEAGIIIRDRNIYQLRRQCLQKSIEEIKEDIDRIFSEMIKIASEIDSQLGNFYR